jgi:uncharacterized protein YjiS (DUF1127 family)
MQDKSSDERFAYDQQIIERERQMDDLSSHKTSILNLLENLETENRRWLHRMQELNDSDLSDLGIQRQMNEFNGKSQYINRLVENDREELTHEFSKSANELEDKRTQLQKERNELPWA